jgi:hypothetical protein
MTAARTFGDLVLGVRFELVSHKPKPRRRFYSLHLSGDRQLALYGKLCGDPSLGWLLVVIRGRLGGKPRRREERFLKFERALERYGALCARRRSHGYFEVSPEETHVGLIATVPQPTKEHDDA